MFKSKIEVREYAVSKAAEIMGGCAPNKDIISKAKEIESYIIGDAELPETYNEIEVAGGLLSNAIASFVDQKSE